MIQLVFPKNQSPGRYQVRVRCNILLRIHAACLPGESLGFPCHVWFNDSMAMQQEPKLNRLIKEVPIPYMFGLYIYIYIYIRPKFEGISQQNMATHMVLTYLRLGSWRSPIEWCAKLQRPVKVGPTARAIKKLKWQWRYGENTLPSP